jgi:hypothetical protein
VPNNVLAVVDLGGGQAHAEGTHGSGEENVEGSQISDDVGFV